MKGLSARFSLLPLLLVCSFVITAQEKRSELRELAEQRLDQRGEVIISFVIPADKGLNHLTTYLSIDNVRHDTVTAYANEDGFRQFLSENIPYELIQPPSLRERARKAYQGKGNWRNLYPSYTRYIALMDSFALNYAGLCRLVEIGTSVQGHKLLAMKISDNPDIREKEPVVFLTSTIHGDEPLGFVLMLRLIEELLGHYETDQQIRTLVDNAEIWINPLSNPDGTYFMSDSSVNGSTRFNANHVDLNRNFPDPAQGDHPDSYDWQKETVAMMDFMKGLSLVLAVNFHGGSEVVNYPWDAFIRLHPDNDWYRSIARAYADTVHTYGPSGYMTALENGITNGYQWYQVFGGRQDYVNYFLHGREVTIELSNDKIPVESTLDEYWNYNKKSFMNYISEVFEGVRGGVTDSVTGLPVAAMVSILNHDKDNSQVYTDPADGSFYRLTTAGDYIFEITSPGYQGKKIPLITTQGTLTPLYAKLSPLAVEVIYPNPFSDILYVNIYEPGEELVLEFNDLSGRMVKYIRQQVVVAGKQDILVTGLASGVYIVNLNYRNKTTRQVVVREGF